MVGKEEAIFNIESQEVGLTIVDKPFIISIIILIIRKFLEY